MALRATLSEPFEYPLVKVRGSARERGQQYGTQVSGRIQNTLSAYEALFIGYAGLEWADVYGYALSYEPIIHDHDPEMIDEMHGIAEVPEWPLRTC